MDKKEESAKPTLKSKPEAADYGQKSFPQNIPPKFPNPIAKHRVHQESFSSSVGSVAFGGIEGLYQSIYEAKFIPLDTSLSSESSGSDSDSFVSASSGQDSFSFPPATSFSDDTAPKLPISTLTSRYTSAKDYHDIHQVKSKVSPTMENIQTSSLDDDDEATEKVQLGRQRGNSEQSIIGSPVIASLDVADRLNLDTFSKWCYVLISLNFDLEVGQDIDYLHPPEAHFTDFEKSNIRFSSFPDSSANVGDTVFSFRFPRTEDPDFYLHGYVFFRQQRDESIKRGYLQKSLCLISHLPLPGLFLRVVALLGPLYMDALKSPSLPGSSKLILESAAHAISQWPSPKGGVVLDLPFLGSVLSAEMPCINGTIGSRAQLLATSVFLAQNRQRNNSSIDVDEVAPLLGEQILSSIPCTVIYPTGFIPVSPENLILAANNDINLISSTGNLELPGTSLGFLYRFIDNLEDLWTIWELALIGEPIVIMAKSQCVVSESVWWITEMIRPIPYSGDFRPYFTIQDSDFRKFTGYFKHINSDTANNTGTSVTNSSFYQLTENDSLNSSAINFSSANISKTNLSRPSSAAATPNRSNLTNISESDADFAPKNLSHASFKSKLSSLFKSEFPLSQSGYNTPRPEVNDNRAVILGVTNPFFSKSMDGWPHVIKISSGPVCENLKNHNPSTLRNSSNSSTSSLTSLAKSNSATASRWSLKKSLNSKSLIDFTPGLSSNYKPYIVKDKKLVKSLLVAFESSTGIPISTTQKESRFQSLFSNSNSNTDDASINSIVNDTLNSITSTATSLNTSKKYKAYALNEILRRHFVDLTERFLVPLNRYFSMLIPAPVQLPTQDLPCVITHEGFKIVYRPPPPMSIFQVRPFDSNAFLAQLVSYGPPKLVFITGSNSSKNNWMEFYLRFLDGANFFGWLKDRRNMAENQVRLQYLDRLREQQQQISITDLDLFLMLRRELHWLDCDPVHTPQSTACGNSHYSAFMSSTTSLENRASFKFLLASAETKQEFEVKAKMLWGAFSKEIRSAFKQGLFDQYLEPLPKKEDDFILVI